MGIDWTKEYVTPGAVLSILPTPSTTSWDSRSTNWCDRLVGSSFLSSLKGSLQDALQVIHRGPDGDCCA